MKRGDGATKSRSVVLRQDQGKRRRRSGAASETTLLHSQSLRGDRHDSGVVRPSRRGGYDQGVIESDQGARPVSVRGVSEVLPRFHRRRNRRQRRGSCRIQPARPRHRHRSARDQSARCPRRSD
ncbi:MAG: hypothetical protein MZU97_11245 [Bacillus subtilis]|nr:hypothetical protein [Bacillus subtilis]